MATDPRSGPRKAVLPPKALERSGKTSTGTVAPSVTRLPGGGFWVTLPVRLPSAANLREGWRERHRRVSEHRAVARLALGPLVKRHSVRFPLTVVMTRIGAKRLDDDNLAHAFKGVRDGIADALGVDDGNELVRWCYGQRTGPPKGYSVEIIIAPRGEGATT